MVVVLQLSTHKFAPMFKLLVDKSGCSGLEPSHTTEPMSESLVIPDFKAQQGEALHRQITKHIRSLIYNGSLPSGSKLPRMHDLAAHWKTNYFTVHTALTGLVREGLLERKPRLGTFVRKQNKELRSVGIYYGDEILIKHERAFYRSLHAELLSLLDKEGVTTKVFIDCRPKEAQSEPFPELLEAISTHAIQGLIVPLINPAMAVWAKKMPLPRSMFSSARLDSSRVTTNSEEIARMGLETLKKQGCRTVGVIYPDAPPPADQAKNVNDSFGYAFELRLKTFGLKTKKAWVRIPKVSQESQEKYGYQEFHKLWSLAERPDGLMIYPENVARGAVLALLERQVKVPAELKLVLHKNYNVDFLCPVQADWIVTRERDVAKALIQQIKDRFAGLDPGRYEIRQQMVEGHPGELAPHFALGKVLKL